MGGNVFNNRASSIKRENIEPTLNNYFSELKTLFPKKSNIFNYWYFVKLGSVGKKSVSGDIDLGIDTINILDSDMSDASIAEWGIDPEAVRKEQESLASRARTSTAEMLRMKAFLKELTKHINQNSTLLHTDETKVSNGNIFGLFPQFDQTGAQTEYFVQIDWMIGNLDWLKFSYYSSAYPEESNVKGLHRTQLLLSAFQVAGLSFNHVTGIKDKETNEIIASDPVHALSILGERLGFEITNTDAEDYYKLHDLFLANMSADDYNRLLVVYFKILDSTRADIPDNLQEQWRIRKDQLGLTGKFLPDNSLLRTA